MQAAFLDWDSLNGAELARDALDRLPVDWHYFANIERSQLQEVIAQFDLVVTNKVVLDAEILQRTERLKLICVAATGTNNVDLQAAQEKNIVVTNARAYGNDSVAQHVFMLMLNLARRFNEYQTSVRAGEWQRSDYFSLLSHPIESLQNKVLGIIGYGELGHAVAKLALAFGMQVKVAESFNHSQPKRQRIPLTELYQQADFISLHCPLTPQTENLINTEVFSVMKASAFLINAARGGIVNERDLLSALQEKQIAGAAIDVLTQEPPTNDALLLNANLPNLIITPHIAWAARESRQTLLNKVAENIEAWIEGNNINQVIAD
jgi:glycerate dehydrogenase